MNETLAARAGRGASPLGAVVELAGVRRTVIAVVADVRNPPLQSAPRPEIYLPWRPSGRGWILAQTGFARPLAAAGALAAAVEAQPGCRRAGPVRELDRVLAADMGVIRLGTALLSAVALGAALLTAAGTFGVVSFVAGRRAREIGIRLSLGASVGGLRRLVLLQELRPVAAGAALGVLLSLALGRVVASRVHGLRPVEPLVLLGASLLFVALLAAACYLPARRATRVDPAVALRAQ